MEGIPVENNMWTGTIILRNDTKENWETNDPVLKLGEIGIQYEDKNNFILKVGDGETTWTNLSSISAIASDVHEWAKEEAKPIYNIEEITGLSDKIQSIEQQLQSLQRDTQQLRSDLEGVL